MDDNNKPITLQGTNALALWRQGRLEWNQWVEAHPVADVDFNGVDFAKERARGTNAIGFSGYHFPKGNVSFSRAKFGKGVVSFDDAKFGEGAVSFYEATFGDGEIWFRNATFGYGDVSFDDATFGNGNVFFAYSNFGNGGISFYNAKFGTGGVSFNKVKFGNGTASFRNVNFGDGNVSFDGVTFCGDTVSFNNANFGDGNVTFEEATFGGGRISISFQNATFGNGNVSFNRATFGEGNISFNQANFKGNTSFHSHQSLGNESDIRTFTLRQAVFEKSLDLSQNNFNCVIDLTNTKMANQVSLDGLRCKLHRTWYGKAKDDRDSERLRRLKEIAENNKDHTQALNFHADEMRAKRWRETTFLKGLGLDLSFDWCSRYGQSIGRPMLALLLITVAFGYLYYAKAEELGYEVTTSDVILYSASNMLPLIPNSREARVKGFKKIFGDANTRLYGLHGWILLQGTLSFIFLFLLGLGLRNRFRI